MRDEIALWDVYGPLFCFEEREVFGPDTLELDFYSRIYMRHPGRCLELGAGDGRVARHIAGTSQVVALEPSSAMLAAWPDESPGGVSRIRAVAQSVPLKPGSMDLVLFPYNGLHCILRREERIKVLNEVLGLLSPEGVFVAEACPQFQIREEETGSERYSVCRGGDTLRLVESVFRDHERSRIVFDMVYTGSGAAGGRSEIRLELALISAGELLRDIVDSGMRIMSVWGDYDMVPWDCESSPRLLVAAGRKKT